jgi:hypothetical protein
MTGARTSPRRHILARASTTDCRVKPILEVGCAIRGYYSCQLAKMVSKLFYDMDAHSRVLVLKIEETLSLTSVIGTVLTYIVR